MIKNDNGIQSKLQQYGDFIWEMTKVIVISLAIIIPVRYYIVQPFYVKGASMEPNFHNYEYLVIDEISYRLHPVHRGDVVVLRNPQQPKQFFIKRVIGLPGETVNIQDREVYVNGTLLDESGYLPEETETWGNQEVLVPDGQYFLLGDNRAESLDSRIFGPIVQDEIIGRTWLRMWPLTRVARFTTIEYNL